MMEKPTRQFNYLFFFLDLFAFILLNVVLLLTESTMCLLTLIRQAVYIRASAINQLPVDTHYFRGELTFIALLDGKYSSHLLSTGVKATDSSGTLIVFFPGVILLYEF